MSICLSSNSVKPYGKIKLQWLELECQRMYVLLLHNKREYFTKTHRDSHTLIPVWILFSAKGSHLTTGFKVSSWPRKKIQFTSTTTHWTVLELMSLPPKTRKGKQPEQSASENRLHAQHAASGIWHCAGRVVGILLSRQQGKRITWGLGCVCSFPLEPRLHCN